MPDSMSNETLLYYGAIGVVSGAFVLLMISFFVAFYKLCKSSPKEEKENKPAEEKNDSPEKTSSHDSSIQGESQKLPEDSTIKTSTADLQDKGQEGAEIVETPNEDDADNATETTNSLPDTSDSSLNDSNSSLNITMATENKDNTELGISKKEDEGLVFELKDHTGEVVGNAIDPIMLVYLDFLVNRKIYNLSEVQTALAPFKQYKQIMDTIEHIQADEELKIKIETFTENIKKKIQEYEQTEDEKEKEKIKEEINELNKNIRKEIKIRYLLVTFAVFFIKPHILQAIDKEKTLPFKKEYKDTLKVLDEKNLSQSQKIDDWNLWHDKYRIDVENNEEKFDFSKFIEKIESLIKKCYIDEEKEKKNKINNSINTDL